MYIPPSERMKKVHVWLGTTAADEETYNAYFDQDEDVSQFSNDIGLDEEYDEDFIGILPIFKNQRLVAEVLANEVPLAIESLTYAIAACERHGIEFVNALFYLTDSTVNIEDPKDNYNGLKYLGVFESAL